MGGINIGDVVEIKANIVDYNDGSEKAKVQITGYAEDKSSFTEKYLWLNYSDIKKAQGRLNGDNGNARS